MDALHILGAAGPLLTLLTAEGGRRRHGTGGRGGITLHFECHVTPASPPGRAMEGTQV